MQLSLFDTGAPQAAEPTFATFICPDCGKKLSSVRIDHSRGHTWITYKGCGCVISVSKSWDDDDPELVSGDFVGWLRAKYDSGELICVENGALLLTSRPR